MSPFGDSCWLVDRPPSTSLTSSVAVQLGVVTAVGHRPDGTMLWI